MKCVCDSLKIGTFSIRYPLLCHFFNSRVVADSEPLLLPKDGERYPPAASVRTISSRAAELAAAETECARLSALVTKLTVCRPLKCRSCLHCPPLFVSSGDEQSAKGGAQERPSGVVPTEHEQECDGRPDHRASIHRIRQQCCSE